MATYRRFRVQRKYINGKPTDETRLGEQIDSTDYTSLEECKRGSGCTNLEYRWVDVQNEYICEGFNKYKKQRREQRCVGTDEWVAIYPYEYQKGEIIENDSVDCGYGPSVECHIYGTTDGHGSINISPSKEYYSSTDVVTITALPSTDYMFSRYNYGSTSEYGQISTNSTLMLTMTHDWYVSAEFSYSLSLYYLYTSINGEGSIMVAPSKNEYSRQEHVNILAFPSANYMFENYEYGSTPAYGSTTLRANLDLTMSNDWYVKANFASGTASSESLYYSYYTGSETWYNWGKSTLSKTDNNGSLASIIIDYGGVVQSIPDKAFYSHSYLTKIILPNVSYIGNSAFLLSKKSKLETAIIPNVEYIGLSAFAYNSKLSQIDIPLCSYIGSGAFRNTGLSYGINVPLCSYIGTNAFYGCSSLEQFDGKILSVVEYNAFYGCSNLTSLNIPLCTYIYDSAFANCVKLPSINLPVCSVIGAYAFYGCSNLRKIDLPMVSYISYSAFENCVKLKSIDLPNCSSIDPDAFENCTELTYINLPNCSHIYRYAFYKCSSLTSVNLQNCSYIDDSVFKLCDNLLSIDLPVCSFIGEDAFFGCGNLQDVYLGSSKVVQIGSSSNYAFIDCNYNLKIHIPNNLCEYYKKIYKSASVRLSGIDKYLSELFVCDLPSVIINSLYYSFSNGSYSWYSFNSNVWWRESDYHGATEIIDYGNVIYRTTTNSIGSSTTNINNLKYISLNGAVAIGSHTFKRATNLERVSFPNVTGIGHMAFAYCYSLRSIVLPKLEQMGLNVFSSCGLLSYVSLGNLSKLNTGVFIDCPNLTNITLTGSSVCSIASNVIPKPNENLSINVPASLLDDYKIVWSSLSERIFPL